MDGQRHVVVLCQDYLVREYTSNIILAPFFEEMQDLEKDCGVRTEINGKEYILRATLVSVIADNLAANQLLGFLAPSVKCFCRLCMITRNELHKCLFFNAEHRTEITHEEQVTDISENPEDKSVKTDSGMKFQSILQDLKYFNVFKNAVFDVLHDLLEGWVPYIINLTLAHFLLKKGIHLDVDALNYRIEIFSYGKTEIKNKPSDTFTVASLRNVSTDHKIKERGAQTWLLLRALPFLLYDKVDHNDINYNYLLDLCEITEILFAPKFHPTIFPYLEERLEYHYNQFNVIYPQEHRINKIHQIAGHYVESIKMFGPLSNFACFKYECKHLLQQKYCKICCNFKNITKTLTSVTQTSQCNTWGIKDKVLRERISFDSENYKEKYCTEITVDEYIYSELLIENGAKPDDTFTITEKINVYSVEYQVGFFVILETGEDDKNELLFGEIKEIYILNDKVLLYCEEWPAQYLEKALNAYCVSASSKYCIIDVDDLRDPKPYSLWSTFTEDDLKYISLKYKIY